MELNPHLHLAGLECLLQGCGRVAFRQELLPYEAGVSGFRDGACYRGIVQLLGIVEVVSARYACGVDMADVLYVGPYGANDIASNLHVVVFIEAWQLGCKLSNKRTLSLFIHCFVCVCNVTSTLGIVITYSRVGDRCSE